MVELKRIEEGRTEQNRTNERRAEGREEKKGRAVVSIDG